jgi:serine/threonine protein kinase
LHRDLHGTRILMSDDDPTVLGSLHPSWPAGDDASSPSGSDEGHARANALPAGTRVQEFEIEGLIGEGGFSVVYRARDTLLGRTIALKEYMPVSLAHRTQGQRVAARTERQRATFELGLRSFVNEARLLASFEHAALVKVYRFWEDNGTAYLVMPLYQGPTLREWLAREGGRAPDEGELLEVLYPLLDALEVMHAQQCYHRDIAPDNILLVADDARETGQPPQRARLHDGVGVRPRLRPVLLDFGAARRVIGGATRALTVILKPGYAPIEQYAETPRARQGPWTDIYALCATLYDAVTGRVPEPSVGRLMHDGLVPASVAAEGLFSPALLAAIDHGMAVKPQDRPSSVAALRALLPGSVGGMPGRAADAARDDEATVLFEPAQAAALFATARAVHAPAGPTARPLVQVDDVVTAARRRQPEATPRAARGASPPVAHDRDRGPAAGRGRSATLIVVAPLAALLLVALAWWWATSGSNNTKIPAGDAARDRTGTSAATPATASTAGTSSAQATDASAPASTANVDPSPASRATPAARAPFTVLAALQDIAAGADPSIDVRASARNPRLVIGRDKLAFSVQSSQPGHVYVFASGTDQSHFDLLFPNARDKRNRIEAGQALQLPRETWSLISAGPPGVNHLLVMVSRSRRSFDGAGLVTKDGGLPSFDLAAAAARWAATATGNASPFIGRIACDPGAACAEGYGAGFVQVEEVRR